MLASSLRSGMAIRLERDPYKVIAAEYHAGGGKMGGVTHAKLRNLRTGTVRERRFRADEAVEPLELERQTMQFLYREGNVSYFMNQETFEQVPVESERLGHAASYLTDGLTLPVEFLDGRPVGVVLPAVVEVRVEQTAPPFHSQGTDNVWKEAQLENGVTIMVPPFIAPGERIRVDVEAGTYIERVKAEKKK